jgi:hypothetical protein
MKLNLLKTKKTESINIDKMSVEQIMASKEFPWCSGHIRPSDKNADSGYWLNPRHQNLFNYDWFSVEDFRDWAKQTGRIIKGKTQEEKDKVMHYYRAQEDPFCGWSVLYYAKHDDLFDYDSNLRANNSFYSDNHDYVNLGLEEEQVLRKFYSDALSGVIYDIENAMQWKDKKLLDRYRQEWRDRWYGMARTLTLLGIGYFGASNLPATITNHAWMQDVVFSIAMYRTLKKMDYDFPDIEFVNSIRY